METSPPGRVIAVADPASTSTGAPPVHTTALRHLRRIHTGKVRDLYEVDADHMLIVTTDRLSAFDVVLPDPIPQKGRVLTEISDFWFRRTTHIVPNQLSEMGLDALPLDGLEVFNAATTLKRHNRKAYDYAQRRGLPMTAGSDAHHAAAVGVACTIVESDDFSVRGILDALQRGTELEHRYLTTRQTIRKTWNNWFRLRRKSRAPAAG